MGEAVKAANDMLNAISKKTLDFKTSNPLFDGKEVNYDMLKRYGSLAYIKKDTSKTGTKEERSFPAPVLGFNMDKHACRCFYLVRRTLIKDIKFDESILAFVPTGPSN